MAAPIPIQTNVTAGSQLLGAVNQIRDGIWTLHSLAGLSANAIAVNQAEMQAVFGCASTSDAQALHDRMANFIAIYDTASADYQKLKDLIDAITT